MHIPWPDRTRVACVVAGLLSVSTASATGPVGPLGPSVPVGGGHASGAPGLSAQPDKVRPPEPRPAGAVSPEPEGNRIEVTGNQVSGTACGSEGVSMNSVDVQRSQLVGRTVIVQGHNVNGAGTRDCPGGQGQNGGNQVNSIRIR